MKIMNKRLSDDANIENPLGDIPYDFTKRQQNPRRHQGQGEGAGGEKRSGSVASLSISDIMIRQNQTPLSSLTSKLSTLLLFNFLYHFV